MQCAYFWDMTDLANWTCSIVEGQVHRKEGISHSTYNSEVFCPCDFWRGPWQCAWFADMPTLFCKWRSSRLESEWFCNVREMPSDISAKSAASTQTTVRFCISLLKYIHLSPSSYLVGDTFYIARIKVCTKTRPNIKKTACSFKNATTATQNSNQ